METNEQVKRELIKEAEEVILQLVKKQDLLKEGDLEQVEQTIFKLCLELGRRWLEQIVDERAQGHRPAARREGECGHRQRLVGERPKQVLTLMGEVRISRPYYQCLGDRDEQEREDCSHGEAPWDRVWGLGSGRTSPGIRKLVSYFAADQTLCAVAETVTRMLPLTISARQVLNLIQPVGETLRQQEEEQMHDVLQQATQKQTTQREQQGHQR